jgi:hypothetical protein
MMPLPEQASFPQGQHGCGFPLVYSTNANVVGEGRQCFKARNFSRHFGQEGAKKGQDAFKPDPSLDTFLTLTITLPCSYRGRESLPRRAMTVDKPLVVCSDECTR